MIIKKKKSDITEVQNLEHAGTFCFHFTESWENIGLIFLKLIIQIFLYLY